jgi:DNA-binding transcriptional regulator LsrR (DeoR family)
MNEQYLTVAEVAKMLDVSRDTVRRMFAKEPGVINLGPQRRRASRRYRILRIPRSVLERVLAGRAVEGETSARNDGELKQGE